MKDKIKELEQRIAGLERELDFQIKTNEKLISSHAMMRELQEEVAKLANQPVGMMFDYRA
jgi:uncharacterized coiled-coil protein SlyX